MSGNGNILIMFSRRSGLSISMTLIITELFDRFPIIRMTKVS
jgi:hypothetical protein